MNATECIKKLSPVLFWDIDKSQADMDKFPSFFVQRVLEYGNWNDWKLLLCYYGKERIVDICKNLRSLDSRCLSYICAISNTRKEEYRCYRMKQLNQGRCFVDTAPIDEKYWAEQSGIGWRGRNSQLIIPGLASMWTAIFADVGVMVLAVLNATRALYTKDLARKNEQ